LVIPPVPNPTNYRPQTISKCQATPPSQLWTSVRQSTLYFYTYLLLPPSPRTLPPFRGSLFFPFTPAPPPSPRDFSSTWIFRSCPRTGEAHPPFYSEATRPHGLLSPPALQSWFLGDTRKASYSSNTLHSHSDSRPTDKAALKPIPANPPIKTTLSTEKKI